MSVTFLRDVMIIVVSSIFSIALIFMMVESLVLVRKVSRLVDLQRRSQESVADIIGVVEQNLTGIVGITGLIMGIKKAYDAFTHSGEKERSEEHGRET